METLGTILPVVTLVLFAEARLRRPALTGPKRLSHYLLLPLRLLLSLTVFYFVFFFSLMAAGARSDRAFQILAAGILFVAFRTLQRKFQPPPLASPDGGAGARKRLFAASFLLLAVSGYVAIQSMARRTEDVRELCRIPVGTPVEAVIPRALGLGFSRERQGALGDGITVERPDRQRLRGFDDRLTGVDAGVIRAGKISLPPFMRNYCVITFAERKVAQTGTRTID